MKQRTKVRFITRHFIKIQTWYDITSYSNFTREQRFSCNAIKHLLRFIINVVCINVHHEKFHRSARCPHVRITMGRDIGNVHNDISQSFSTHVYTSTSHSITIKPLKLWRSVLMKMKTTDYNAAMLSITGSNNITIDITNTMHISE